VQKVKSKFVLVHNIKAYGGGGGEKAHIYSSARDGGDWPAARTGRFKPRGDSLLPTE
jgi:hypothetical protein